MPRRQPGRPFVLAHGGAGAGHDKSDGPEAAAKVALGLLREGAAPLEAAVAACRALEDDGRFNAGRGSTPRLDGRTVEADAACMTDDGGFGAVVGLRGYRNPVLAAQGVHGTPHNALVGEGAALFAARLGLEAAGAPSSQATARAATLRRHLLDAGRDAETGWRLDQLRNAWNYSVPPPSDTVGAVACDGRRMAAAGSTGGLAVTLLGRASDIGMLGAGIYAGPHGAVACTGQGEAIARHLLAYTAYLRMEAGGNADEAAAHAVAQLEPRIDVGLILLAPESFAALTNCAMPWGWAG